MKIKHVVLIGESGYVGQAFQEVLRNRGVSYRNFSRKDVNYYHPEKPRDALAADRLAVVLCYENRASLAEISIPEASAMS